MNYLHEAFMQSVYAVGNSDPNPPVGAVLVDQNDNIIGAGYTQQYGSHHAEVMAVEDAIKKNGRGSAAGSTLYVTLEPCSHYGKTPPCTNLIKESGIARVVIVAPDQTEKVAGAQALKSYGVEVQWADIQSYREELLWTIDGFHFFQKNKRPRVMLKWAQTKNGWLAPMDGPSGPVSGSYSREAVFRMRKLFHCTLVTPATVYHDRPSLNPRFNGHCKLPGLGDSFLGNLLGSFERDYPERFRALHKRFFMLPRLDLRWTKADLEAFVNFQATLPGEFFFITDDLAQKEAVEASGREVFFVADYNDFGVIVEYAASRGAINLMVEAGPVFSQTLVDRSFADFLFVFKSNREIWGNGRGFSLSFLAAKNDERKIREAGFTKLYDMAMEPDVLAVYQKDSLR